MLGCPAGYPQLLLLYSRVNGRAVVSIQDTGFREYLSSARSRWSNIARHSREEGKKERKRGEKKETYHRVAIIARSSRPTYFCPIHRTIRRAEGERKRRGITFSRRTESHSLSPPPIPIRVESFPVEKFHLVLPFSSGDRCPLASKGTDFNIRLELTSASN